jgi:hypothetical protein
VDLDAVELAGDLEVTLPVDAQNEAAIGGGQAGRSAGEVKPGQQLRARYRIGDDPAHSNADGQVVRRRIDRGRIQAKLGADPQAVEKIGRCRVLSAHQPVAGAHLTC